MIKNRQIVRLRQLLGEGKPLYLAALKVGMDTKTARMYRHADRLPSESFSPRTWRTREDPFQEVWPQLRDQLENNPGLQANTLFAELQRRFPGRFADGQLRTLQRKIKAWRATEGPPKEVFFDQIHTPGQLCASDFTHMNDLSVTIAGQPFDHMVYHFVLTYSNWETATVCFSESFESLSQGFQNALWELGGVPQLHRTDRLSAAINDHCDKEFFTQRYRALLAHYGLKAQAIAARQAHQNGDVEQSHNRFKTAVDQALMLRGSREFSDRAGYEQFLRELCAQRNKGRAERFAEERPNLRDLPSRRVDAWHRQKVRVTQGSTIRVRTNTYAVPSRLIGEHVDVHVMAEYLEVWHGTVLVERLPRLRGRNKYAINYRHVIDWLVRKPGAFAAYRYQDAMFPSSRFRRAYDALLEHSPARAAKDYLRILELAAKESETGVDAVLGRLLEWNVPITPTVVEDHLRHELGLPRAMDVVITQVDLSMYDLLLETREDIPLANHPTCMNL
jgi:Mu transposase, C-terminal domain